MEQKLLQLSVLFGEREFSFIKKEILLMCCFISYFWFNSNDIQVSMKKIYFLFSFLTCLTISNAQIQIQSQHLPSSGDNINYTNSVGVNIDVSKKNGSHFWDFRNLNTISQEVYEFKQSSQTPYIINFGFNAIGLKIADSLGAGDFTFQDLYNFFRKSATAWQGVGLGFRVPNIPLPIAGRNSKNDVIFKLPLKYEDTFAGDFSLTVPLGFGILKIGDFFQTGNRETVVDGYGFISTPTRDSVPCIRVKSTVARYDSIAITQPSINFGFPSNQVEYKWLSTTDKVPVLEVTGIIIGNTFVPNQTRFAGWVVTTEDMSANFVADKTAINKDDVVKFTDVSLGDPTSWSWSIAPNTGWEVKNGTTNSKSMEAIFTADGRYTVSLTVEKNGKTDTETKVDYINVVQKLSIPESTDKVSLRLYPNPSSDVITLETVDHIEVVFIYDAGGKIVEVIPDLGHHYVLDVKTYAKGNYLAVIKTESTISHQKFSVQ